MLRISHRFKQADRGTSIYISQDGLALLVEDVKQNPEFLSIMQDVNEGYTVPEDAVANIATNMVYDILDTVKFRYGSVARDDYENLRAYVSSSYNWKNLDPRSK